MKLHRTEAERSLAEAAYAQQETRTVRALLQQRERELSRLLNDRERELAAMHRSTSWKVTAPLRMIGRLLRSPPPSES